MSGTDLTLDYHFYHYYLSLWSLWLVQTTDNVTGIKLLPPPRDTKLSYSSVSMGRASGNPLTHSATLLTQFEEETNTGKKNKLV